MSKNSFDFENPIHLTKISYQNKSAYECLHRAAEVCPGDSILLGVKYHIPVGFTGAA